MERIALKKIERKLDKFEKKAGKAWDKVAAELDDLNDDQGQQQQQAAAPLVVSAYDGGSAVWMVLADRTVRAHPGESSSKLGTISTGTRVHVLESATKDSRGKQRLKVHGGGLVGWVSIETGSGQIAMEEYGVEEARERRERRENMAAKARSRRENLDGEPAAENVSRDTNPLPMLGGAATALSSTLTRIVPADETSSFQRYCGCCFRSRHSAEAGVRP